MEDFSIETKWKDDPGITHYEEINSDNGIFSVIYCERHSGGMGNLKAVTHTQKAQKKYEKTLERR